MICHEGVVGNRINYRSASPRGAAYKSEPIELTLFESGSILGPRMAMPARSVYITGTC